MNINLKQAVEFAEWSQRAYREIPIPAGTDFEWITDSTNKVDVTCLVVYQSDKLIFSFQGTHNFSDFLIDAKVKFKKCDNGFAFHNGFYEDVDAVWNKLSLIAAKSRVPIYTCGHSKGSAESRIFTYRLAMEKSIIVKASYGYGEPRSMSRITAIDYDKINIPTYRFVDSSDGVNRVPWLCGKYRHVHSEIFIDEWLNLVINEPWYSHIPSDLSDIIKELWHRKLAVIDDHSISLYHDKLQKIQNNFN